MGEDELRILTKCLEMQKQLKRDARGSSFLRALVGSLIGGLVTAGSAGWIARDYIASQRDCVRTELRVALDPIVQSQREATRVQYEHGQAISLLHGTLETHIAATTGRP